MHHQPLAGEGGVRRDRRAGDPPLERLAAQRSEAAEEASRGLSAAGGVAQPASRADRKKTVVLTPPG